MRPDEYFEVHLEDSSESKAQSYLILRTPFSNMHVASLLSSAAEPNVNMQLRNLYVVLI
jgi:hypothetical protein